MLPSPPRATAMAGIKASRFSRFNLGRSLDVSSVDWVYLLSMKKVSWYETQEDCRLMMQSVCEMPLLGILKEGIVAGVFLLFS
jgi:hypothetical protein